MTAPSEQDKDTDAPETAKYGFEMREGPGAGLWIALALAATLILGAGAALWFLFVRFVMEWYEVLP